MKTFILSMLRHQAISLLGPFAILFGAACWAAPTAPGVIQRSEAVALQLTIDGPIGPPTAAYVTDGLGRAALEGAAVVVLRIDTPGGLDTSMREIVRAILASPVPVLSYVWPSGARAASAGTYILYASHVAAMAPGTNLGAATPVSLSGDGMGLPRGRPASAASAPGNAPANASAMESKQVNDAVAYIRSLANLRERNVAWAEAAVREAASLSAHDALREGVIDVVAESVPDLLAQVHGRKVRMAARSGAVAQARVVTLDTEGLAIQASDPNLRIRILSVLSNPNLALMLMMLGVYGLLFEFMNPGAAYPGIVGAICLLLGMYALSTLPLNLAGIALLVLGIGLMLAEAFTPSLGALGIGGAIAFLLGSGMLLDESAPGFALSMPLAAGLAAAALGFGLLVARMAVRGKDLAKRTGSAAMLDASALVQDWQADAGHVFIAGERWNARGPQGLSAGQRVRVTAIDGLTLTVVPWSSEPVRPPDTTPPARP